MATVAVDLMTDVRERVDGLDWSALGAQLDEVGHAVTPVLLSENECDERPTCSTAGGFARRSTWHAIALAMAATATSTIRSLS